MRTGLFLALLSLLPGCSYQPEDPGLCKLNCSNAIISGNDSPLSIKLKTITSSISCEAAAQGQAINDPLFVQFLVAEAFDGGGGVTGQRPVPSISIEPIVNGLRSDQPEHNPNVDPVDLSNGIFNPARYKGIITPKENWCSDSCGVVTMEIAAVCPPAGATSDVTIQMHSGALYSEPATYTTTTVAPQ